MAETLPINNDLERFAPFHNPEKFTDEELRYLKPFFSNTDLPVYIIKLLPDEVVAALLSRYSRAEDSIRRIFLKEYVGQIVHPEETKEWPAMSKADKREALKTKKQFLQFIKNNERNGGVEGVVNVKRARKFFQKWLSDYGDDSIAELAGFHICLEGISNLAAEEIVDKRVGLSLIIKSSRYVSFIEKRADGQYQYHVPGEIAGTPLEAEYRQAMDLLFNTLAQLSPEYLDYIKGRYPKDDQESGNSFARSRGAKRWDDLRGLLPFATQTNMGMFGNARAIEDLVNRLIMHPNGEVRYWAQHIGLEVQKIAPSLMARPSTERGAKVQKFKANQQQVAKEIFDELHIGEVKSDRQENEWVRLISHTLRADIEVLAEFVFEQSSGVDYETIRKAIAKIPKRKRLAQLKKIFATREFDEPEVKREALRFKKVHKAFEVAHYLYAVWCRGGDFRDLHRHRMATILRQLFTITHGFDLEPDVHESPFAETVMATMGSVNEIFRKMHDVSPELAQYVVPFDYLQHWTIELSAREIYWMGELRTGPQARQHYKDVVLAIVDLARTATPGVMMGIQVDREKYQLARRESEIKKDKKATSS